jgi:GntR family transcriptional regulator
MEIISMLYYYLQSGERMVSKEDVEFNRSKPISLYYQLEEKFLKKIQTGEWKSGQKIPPEIELCRIYKLSRITVRKAIEELVHSGHLIRFQGKGTFVANSVGLEQKLSKFYSFSEALLQNGKKEHVKMLSFTVEKADAGTAGSLRIDKDEKVFKVLRLRSVDDTAYAVEVSYIPHSLCPRLTEKDIVEKGLYNSMRALGVKPQRIIEKFRADAIRSYEAKQMKLKTGQPIIHIERTTFDGPVIIELCNSIVRGDFFTYTVELKT